MFLQETRRSSEETRRSSHETVRSRSGEGAHGGGENDHIRPVKQQQGTGKHHSRSVPGNSAEARGLTGGSTGDASGGDQVNDWKPRSSQRFEALGRAGSAGLDDSNPAGKGESQVSSPAGAAAHESASSAHTAGLSQSEGGLSPGLLHSPIKAAAGAVVPPASHYVNPFLAASQNWHASDSGESAEESGPSSNSISEGFRQPSAVPNPFAAAAAAEQWLARQSSMAESDDSNERWEVGLANSRSVSGHLDYDRQSPVGSPRSQYRRETSKGKRAVHGQPDQDMQSPFAVHTFPQQSPCARAGPPPAKSAFRHSPAESASSGESPDESWEA